MDISELFKKLKANPDNPRTITEKDFEKLKKSIKELPKMLDIRPLAYDSSQDYIVLGGNQRLEGLKALTSKNLIVLKPEWFVDIKDWTAEEKRQFIIKDNISNGDWNWDVLANSWDKEELAEWGMDLGKWKDPMDEDYSQKLGEVIYEPKETNHKVKDLFKIETKFDEDIAKIENKDLQRLFQARAFNFTAFDFEKVADYYAYQATPEEQRVFEKLALVLLDKDKMIENGFSKLINKIDDSPEDYEIE